MKKVLSVLLILCMLIGSEFLQKYIKAHLEIIVLNLKKMFCNKEVS